MSKNIQAIRGMNDILPEEAKLWSFLDAQVSRLFADYGYANIRLPLVEVTQLFNRSIGEVTDIVEREMYTFADRNGDSLTLRPEATAGIVRAAIEHNLLYDGPKKVWTGGPMFRYERPQKGRYRQFHQIDAEALGFAGPEVDAEQMVMLARLWKQLGIVDVELHINSIGDAPARAQHRVDLVKYFEAHFDELDEDARRRLHSNPLRTLDTKNPALQALVGAAPKLAHYLDESAREHFAGLQALLGAAALAAGPPGAGPLDAGAEEQPAARAMPRAHMPAEVASRRDDGRRARSQRAVTALARSWSARKSVEIGIMATR